MVAIESSVMAKDEYPDGKHEVDETENRPHLLEIGGCVSKESIHDVTTVLQKKSLPTKRN